MALLACAIAVALFVAYHAVSSQLRSQVDRSLQERAAAIASISSRRSATRNPSARPPRIVAAKLGEATGYIQFVSAGGKVRLPPGERIRLPVAGAAGVAAGENGATFTDASVAGTHVRIYTTRLNGQTAIQKIRTSPPDLMTLDLMMPGVTGWEVIEQIRGIPNAPPVVLVSGSKIGERKLSRQAK